jgi:multisubunit Na+/H+ antiporter MnhC subunit
MTSSSSSIVSITTTTATDNITTAMPVPEATNTTAIVVGCVVGAIWLSIVGGLHLYCHLKKKQEQALKPPPDDTLEAIFARQQTAAQLQLPQKQ